MNLTLPVRVKRNGSLANADSVPLLADPTNSFGVRRTDTGDVVVATGTAMTLASNPGIYAYTLIDAVAGVQYEFWPNPIVDGTTYPIQKFIAASDPSSQSYLTSDQADAIVANFPGLAKYKAASADQKTAALLLGSIDVDTAEIYQGRRFIPGQVLEFPRMAYAGAFASIMPQLPTPILATDPYFWPYLFAGLVIFDWDDDTMQAVVPDNINLAVIYQADSILKGDRDQRLQDIADGLAAQAVGPVSEQYRQDADPSRLCDRARRLVQRYVLRQGKLL